MTDRRALAPAYAAKLPKSANPVLRKGHYPELAVEAFRCVAERRGWNATHSIPELSTALRAAGETLRSIGQGNPVAEDDLVRSATTLSFLVAAAARYDDLVDAAALLGTASIQRNQRLNTAPERTCELANAIALLARRL